MDILINKTKDKSPITSQILNVYNCSVNVNGKNIHWSYYGYTKRKALIEFKKLIEKFINN